MSDGVGVVGVSFFFLVSDGMGVSFFFSSSFLCVCVSDGVGVSFVWCQIGWD